MAEPPSWRQAVAHYNPPPAARSTTPPVYSRDFAYAHAASVVLVHRPMRIERDNVASSSARSFAQLLAGPTVEIYVGTERKCWTLHRNLLCHHSTYFETEFQGHEVPRRHDRESLDLPDDDPRGFELLVKWLYQGQLEDVSDFIDDERKYDYAVACHKLYVLCDKFDMIQLKNMAMDQYRLGLHQAQLVPDADEIDEIYRNSPHHSPFRRLMTKIAARQIMDPEAEKDAENYRKCWENNPDFAVEMINNIRSMSGGILFDDPTGPDDDCLYHDHIDGSGYLGKEKSKGKAKAITNGACPPKSPIVQKRQLPLIQQSPASSKQGPIELPAGRRSPRKLNLSSQQHPTQARKTSSSLRPPGPQPVSNAQANSKPHPPSSTTPAPRKLRKPSPQHPNATKNPTKPHSKAPPSRPRRRRSNSTASTATHTTASTHSSVLGKRPAAAIINGRSTNNKRASIDEGGAVGTVRKRGSVNGIVRQLDGTTGREGGESRRSQGDEEEEGGKKAPSQTARRTTSFFCRDEGHGERGSGVV
ncbi:hypothetical protein EJ03DRAFT_328478 [Teratosphaeria nubilosa]|uniref:BTB domain-containing protein n=1 Tax=Teratosphaeria nubilosa TaxID=161662 RepID=A0A6G1L6V2_9PEZI|nr:hypothetical protein EJ03DRAFT_328478 [Teratosphaeria nubilosa]